MKCDDLRAYIDGEGDFLNRVIMFLHLMLCAKCRRTRAEWSRLSPSIRRLEDVTVPPTLREKLLADAIAADIPAQTQPLETQFFRIREAFGMKKVAIALSCAVVLIVAMLLFPARKHNTAFAAVSRAMSNVKSIHFSGYGRENGVDHRIEAWIEHPSKLRMRIEGQNDQIVADDIAVVITPSQVVIKPLGMSKEEKRQGMSAFLAYFEGDFWGSMGNSNIGKSTVKKVKRPDGKFDTVFTTIGVASLIAGKDKLVITVSGDSNLVTRLQEFNGRNEIVIDIDRIEYNVPIPSSVFHPVLPKNLPVTDLATPVSEKEKAYRFSEYNRLLSDSTSIQVTNTAEHSGGSKWTPIFHPGYVFESMDNGSLSVFYQAEKDMYYVIGIAKVYDAKYGTGFSTVVRNGSVRIPRKAQLVETLMQNARVGEYRGLATDRNELSDLDGVSPGDPQIGAFRFVNIGHGPLTIKWHRTKKQYIIKGRAKLLPLGEIYENQVLPLADGYQSQDLIKRARSLSHPDFANLPEQEVVIMKAELSRQTALMDLDQSEWSWPERGVMELQIKPVGWELPGQRKVGFPAKSLDDQADATLKFEPVGPTREADIVKNRDKREFRIIGDVRLLPSGRVVKNGVVTYSGEVKSSE